MDFTLAKDLVRSESGLKLEGLTIDLIEELTESDAEIIKEIKQ